MFHSLRASMTAKLIVAPDLILSIEHKNCSLFPFVITTGWSSIFQCFFFIFYGFTISVNSQRCKWNILQLKEMQHLNEDSCNFQIFETTFFEQYLTNWADNPKEILSSIMKILELFFFKFPKKNFRPRKILENFQGENSYVTFLFSYKLEFVLFIKIQWKKFKQSQILERKTLFSNGKFLGNVLKILGDALGPSKPFKEYVYKFLARLFENSSRIMGWETLRGKYLSFKFW